MRFGRLVALVATVVGGLMTFGAAPSQALPIGPGAMPDVKGGAVEQVQYYYRPQRRVVVRRNVYRPVYGGRRYYRPPVVAYRPIRRPRVVCSTRVQVVRTAYGYVRRPVRVCRRVF
ncbi:MAG TPA: hypothetical protein VEA41_16930 [Salinarimonas sp.]|jgi:hypothetical protein|nr:hypothetical protein [Salinarimonas sp.]